MVNCGAPQSTTSTTERMSRIGMSAAGAVMPAAAKSALYSATERSLAPPTQEAIMLMSIIALARSMPGPETPSTCSTTARRAPGLATALIFLRMVRDEASSQSWRICLRRKTSQVSRPDGKLAERKSPPRPFARSANPADASAALVRVITVGRSTTMPEAVG
eukprot:scaffold44749_cov64-Phaeocystis_antarctica.AAC.4